MTFYIVWCYLRYFISPELLLMELTEQFLISSRRHSFAQTEKNQLGLENFEKVAPVNDTTYAS